MKIFNKIYEFFKEKDEIYHKPISTVTERAGFKINEDLLGRVLKEKYKNKYLPK